jgi:hypothetical protein
VAVLKIGVGDRQFGGDYLKDLRTEDSPKEQLQELVLELEFLEQLSLAELVQALVRGHSVH